MEKTAEEILKNHFVKYYRKDFPHKEITDDDLYRKVMVFYEEEKTIISAMEEYASQFKHPVPDEAGGVYVWVKASERLPNRDGKYICKKKPVSNEDIYVNEVFFAGGVFKTGQEVIEWLSLHPSQPEGDDRLKIQATEIVESFEPMCLKYEDAAKKCAILHYELMIDEESVENISIHGIERIKHYKELIKTIKSL